MIDTEKIKNALKNVNIEDEHTIFIRVSYQLEKQGYKILEKPISIKNKISEQKGKNDYYQAKRFIEHNYLISKLVSENGTKSCLKIIYNNIKKSYEEILITSLDEFDKS